MKKFMAIYVGAGIAKLQWESLDSDTRKDREKAGMIAWANWAKEHERVIADSGAPLGRTKRVNAKGISDVKNELAAYTIVEAESQDEAAKLFLKHPHFTIFPGDSVEIMECLPLPNM